MRGGFLYRESRVNMGKMAKQMATLLLGVHLIMCTAGLHPEIWLAMSLMSPKRQAINPLDMQTQWTVLI